MEHWEAVATTGRGVGGWTSVLQLHAPIRVQGMIKDRIQKLGKKKRKAFTTIRPPEILDHVRWINQGNWEKWHRAYMRCGATGPASSPSCPSVFTAVPYPNRFTLHAASSLISPSRLAAPATLCCGTFHSDRSHSSRV